MKKKRSLKSLGRVLALIALSVGLCFTLTSCSTVIRGVIDMAQWLLEDESSPDYGSWEPDAEVPDYPAKPDKEEWRTIPYWEMEYTRPDVEGITSQLREMTERAWSATSFDEVLGWDWEATRLMEDFYTMRNLAEVRKYVDGNDSFYDEEYRFCDEAAVDLSNVASDFNEAVVEGPFAEEYRAEVGDYVFESIKADLMLSSDEVQEYEKERSRLNADYNQRLTTLTVSHGGQEYTMEDIDALPVTTMEEYDLYYALLIAYYRENAAWFAETYARMIELDKLTAEQLGFASAADMYYQQYSRDYTPEDTRQFFATAKELYAPMVPQVMDVRSYGITMDYTETFARMPGVLGALDPELAEVWNGMIEYGLYDYEAKAGKQSGIGFTTQLYAYDASFCYGYWEDDLRSAFTAIHEFGHYYDNWLHMEEDVVQNLDVAEIYSQGLEVLSFAYLDQLTPYAEEAAQENLSDMFQALTFQPLLEEFQLRLYEMDSFTADDAGRLFSSLLVEYGYGDYTLADENGVDNSWFEYTHLFDAPFYTISYATSACAALQFWALSQDDHAGAVAAYLNLIKSDQNRPFQEMLAADGLRSPFDRELLVELEQMYRRTFGIW